MSDSICIIGGGPAGCAAGISLLQNGHRVTLLESASFPRHRPGETLHPGVQPLFEKLGVWERVLSATSVRHTGIDVIDTKQNRRFESFGSDGKGAWKGIQIERAELDRILLDRAFALGAKVRQPCHAIEPLLEGEQVVGVKTSAETIQSKWLVDCSGKRQFLKHQLRLSETKFSPRQTAYFGYVAVDPDEIEYETPCFEFTDEGWNWICKVSPSVNAWVKLDRTNSFKGESRKPEVLRRFPNVGGIRGADVTWRKLDRMAGDGWFCVGDAASNLDPSSSHGMMRAMMGGLGAAALIDQFGKKQLSQKQVAQVYSAWLSSWFLRDVRQLKKIRKDQASENSSSILNRFYQRVPSHGVD